MKKILIYVVLTVMAIGAMVQDSHALGQRAAVIRIRQIAKMLDLTPQQARNRTMNQAYNELTTYYPNLPADKLKEAEKYWTGIHKFIIADADKRVESLRVELMTLQFESEMPNGDWRHENSQELIRKVWFIKAGGDPNEI